MWILWHVFFYSMYRKLNGREAESRLRAYNSIIFTQGTNSIQAYRIAKSNEVS